MMSRKTRIKPQRRRDAEEIPSVFSVSPRLCGSKTHFQDKRKPNLTCHYTVYTLS